MSQFTPGFLHRAWRYVMPFTCGERIFNLKRLYNARLGISRKDDKLPDRFLTHRRREGETAENLPPFNIMLSDYCEFLGWDEGGVPRLEKLEELDLATLAGCCIQIEQRTYNPGL